MTISKSEVDAGLEKAEDLVDESVGAVNRGAYAAAAGAKKAIRSTAKKIDRTLDEKDSAISAAGDLQRRATDFVREIFDISSRGLSESFENRRARAQQLSDESLQKTAEYVQQRPLRAMCIAATVGAVAVLLLTGGRRK